MGLAIVAVLIGLIVLTWSADVFIDGATLLAEKLRVPGFLIGVVILGFGTSAPEMVVSALSALQGNPELALGNAYGSNIMNIALVLGITATISPIVIRRSVVTQDLPLLLVMTALAAWQLRDGQLSRADGALLLISLAAVLGFQIFLSIREGNPKNKHKDSVQIISSKDANSTSKNSSPPPSIARGMSSLFIGMLLLVLSSRAVVWGAVELATFWGLSELVIGLTVVAIGTSLPELVASLSAAGKGEHDMALGSIIGSNIFNTLGVVGLAAFITPIAANPVILSRDIVMVGILTLLLFTLSTAAFISNRKLGRVSGATLVLSFIAYTIWLFKTINM